MFYLCCHDASEIYLCPGKCLGLSFERVLNGVFSVWHTCIPYQKYLRHGLIIDLPVANELANFNSSVTL